MKTKPDYYKSGENDVIAFCQHHDLDFATGNIIKYLVRAGKKGSKQDDLAKAKEYLDRMISSEPQWVAYSINVTCGSTQPKSDEYGVIKNVSNGEDPCAKCKYDGSNLDGLCDSCVERIGQNEYYS